MDEKQIKEMKDALKKDYLNNANRLKKIPEELSSVKLNLELSKEDLQIKEESLGFVLVDLKRRLENFGVADPKYKWETDPEWENSQRELIKLEIRKTELNQRINLRSKIATELNTMAQIEEIESQKKRCIDAHKTALKRLLEECKVSPEEYSELKKNCTEKCCR